MIGLEGARWSCGTGMSPSLELATKNMSVGNNSGSHSKGIEPTCPKEPLHGRTVEEVGMLRVLEHRPGRSLVPVARRLNEDHSARHEALGNYMQRVYRIQKVLQHIKHDYHIETGIRKHLRKFPRSHLNTETLASERSDPGTQLQPDSVKTCLLEQVNERPMSTPDLQHPSGRSFELQNVVQPIDASFPQIVPRSNVYVRQPSAPPADGASNIVRHRSPYCRLQPRRTHRVVEGSGSAYRRTHRPRNAARTEQAPWNRTSNGVPEPASRHSS